jgi:hypothetical protein
MTLVVPIGTITVKDPLPDVLQPVKREVQQLSGDGLVLAPVTEPDREPLRQHRAIDLNLHSLAVFVIPGPNNRMVPIALKQPNQTLLVLDLLLMQAEEDFPSTSTSLSQVHSYHPQEVISQLELPWILARHNQPPMIREELLRDLDNRNGNSIL